MKIAYIILAHKLPDQLVRLVKRLNTPDTSFFIHMDKKTNNDIYYKVEDSLKSNNNIYFLDREVTDWGRFNTIKATLNGIHRILSTDLNFDYLISLSGQDYPIKSNNDITEFLRTCDGRSRMDYFTPPDPDAERKMERIEYWHIYWYRWHLVIPREDIFEHCLLNKVWNIFIKMVNYHRKIPGGFSPYFGYTFWCLSRDCIKYIDEFTKKNKSYLHFFRYSKYPDEALIQTIIMNSPLKNKIENQGVHYFDFSSGKAHPALLGIKDFDRFMTTDKLFARKFDMSVDPEVLNMIDEKIG